MSDIITGLHAVTLHIRDPNKARLFYRDVLGLKELLFDEKSGRIVFALPDTSALLTMHIMRPGEGGREPGTVTGVVFRNPDPAAACREIARRGGTITMEPSPFETPLGTFVRAAFADPDGNEFLISNRTD
ncbi:MAG TPA: VOC family protein [Thermoplasmata archaeon]|nr:VOC family protein [Thermoplasmata archaeon]